MSAFTVLETSSEFRRGLCGAFNGETVCGKPRGHDRGPGVGGPNRWHRFPSPYDARWIEYSDDGAEQARGGGIWRYVHAMQPSDVAGLDRPRGLACGDERADLRYWQVPAVFYAEGQAGAVLDDVADEVTCPGCRSELGLERDPAEVRLDGGPKSAAELHLVGRLRSASQGSTSQVPYELYVEACRLLGFAPGTILAAGDYETAAGILERLDFEPLGEDVSGHCMFLGWEGHADGRKCYYHSRLGVWVFHSAEVVELDGGWGRCLREDHPDLDTWRYGAPRLVHMDQLPGDLPIGEWPEGMCAFLYARHKSACRVMQPGETSPDDLGPAYPRRAGLAEWLQRAELDAASVRDLGEWIPPRMDQETFLEFVDLGARRSQVELFEAGLQRCGAVGDDLLNMTPSQTFGPCVLAPHDVARAPWHRDSRGQEWRAREPAAVPARTPPGSSMFVIDEVARLLELSASARTALYQQLATELGRPPGDDLTDLRTALERAVVTLTAYAAARTVKP